MTKFQNPEEKRSFKVSGVGVGGRPPEDVPGGGQEAEGDGKLRAEPLLWFPWKETHKAG